MELSKVEERLNSIKTAEELKEFFMQLRILASNNRANVIVIRIVEDCIRIADQLKDFKSQVMLNGLLILQYIQNGLPDVRL